MICFSKLTTGNDDNILYMTNCHSLKAHSSYNSLQGSKQKKKTQNQPVRNDRATEMLLPYKNDPPNKNISTKNSGYTRFDKDTREKVMDDFQS